MVDADTSTQPETDRVLVTTLPILTANKRSVTSQAKLSDNDADALRIRKFQYEPSLRFTQEMHSTAD